MIELELTYLAKSLPEGLVNSPSKQIVDLYVNDGTNHSHLRIRKNGDTHEITHKSPTSEGDASQQTENTIPLNPTEFASLQSADAKKVSKTRYFYEYAGRTIEFDVFEGDLAGLVMIDVEFDSLEDKAAFAMPDFCLVDVTQEEFVAGGILAGKTYQDIEQDLNRFNYQKLSL